jgi:hypothetical protein
MNPSTNRLWKLLSTSDGQKAFLDWYAEDMTQLLIASCRELAKPKPQMQPDATTSIYECGRAAGANEIIDFIAEPRRGSELLSDNVTGLPVATYGCKDILSKEARNAQ